MQDILTTAFEAITLSFLTIMCIDFVHNFPHPTQPKIPCHPRIEIPSLLDAAPRTAPDPWFEPLTEVAMITGKQEEPPKVDQLLLAPAIFQRETKDWMKADELMKESIRSLKKHASQAGIKRYSNMTKNELIEALLSA